MTALPVSLPTGVIRQRPTALVTIGGVPTPVTNWRTSHGVDQPIGSLSVTLPRHGDVSHIDNNAPIEVQAGYDDAPAFPVFSGRTVDIDWDFGAGGRSVRLQSDDSTALLAFPSESDTVFNGATAFRDIFRSFATVRALPLWSADEVTFPDGITPVVLGGVAGVDDGNVIIKRRTAWHTWITQKARLFGYRVFGTPSGVVRLQRVSGTPASSPVASFVEGRNLYRIGTRTSTRPMVTNWTVSGARYADADGVTIELRSIPGVVPTEPYLDPPGYRSQDASDSILTTQDLTDAVRNVLEIDHGGLYQTVTWETWGHPEIQPGDVISVTSPSTNIPTITPYWVTSVVHEWSSRGFTTTLEGWAGHGVALEPGIDETLINVGSGIYRLGDEYLYHYAIPAPLNPPTNEKIVVPFTVPDVYTSLALRFRQHGTNSYQISGANTESTVSKLEVWQGGERIGTAQLPMSPENLSKRYPYTDDQYWTSGRMPIPGRLEQGEAELHILAGRDSRIAAHLRIDDYEIKNLQVEARGSGTPILPGGGA